MTRKLVTCPRCKGKGEREEPVSRTRMEMMRCLTCNGAQLVTRAVDMTYGRLVKRVRTRR